MKSNLKGAPGIYIDDFDTYVREIAAYLSEIGADNLVSENDLGRRLICISNILFDYVNSICDYRAYLIKCIRDKGEYCGYTEGELMRFSVGILENIFVLNHCHDVDYQEVLRYNKEHANDPEGGAADEK